jgi:hypothetical protein
VAPTGRKVQVLPSGRQEVQDMRGKRHRRPQEVVHISGVLRRGGGPEINLPNAPYGVPSGPGSDARSEPGPKGTP